MLPPRLAIDFCRSPGLREQGPVSSQSTENMVAWNHLFEGWWLRVSPGYYVGGCVWYFHIRFCNSQWFLEMTSRALISVVGCGWCVCQTKLLFASFESVSSARLSLSTMDFEVGTPGIIFSVSRSRMSALDFGASFAFLILLGTALSFLVRSWPRLKEDAMR